ncbi:hypothetical protein [Pseudofrankia sp. DC12]|uniref:hypothetical protein n=1 Tax=Pseudofrankia sp. DC12 TaxID=683315 RepID=UPI000AFADA7C|nr:hypothetical protein [Pseudofrankia sp. DC12]
MTSENTKVYTHEFIDIRGSNRASYVHHMTASWSPIAQEERDQLCYAVWGVIGTTGRWPQVINMWEEDGFDGLAAGGEQSHIISTNGPSLARRRDFTPDLMPPHAQGRHPRQTPPAGHQRGWWPAGRRTWRGCAQLRRRARP